jgi:hypothetical protein
MHIRIMKKQGMALAGGLLALAGLTGCADRGSAPSGTVREELAGLRITEIMYHPLDNGTTDGDAYEFIELKNTGAARIDLTNIGFSDGIDYTFAGGAGVEPDSFIVLAANNGEFISRYGFAPYGIYTSNLSNAGEKVSLKDLTVDAEFLSVEYSDAAPWPVAADGYGPSLVPLSEAQGGLTSDPARWRASFRSNGSPGKDDPGVVYINEVLTHTDPPQKDAIELYNPNNAPVDVGGWFLTDRRVDPVKLRIPAGTVIAANGYQVFYLDSIAATDFLLSAHGEEVWLFAESTGTRAGGYAHGFSFGEIENGVSFGRYITSTGEEHFAAQKSLTLGTANAGPLVGPLVISEIMYNPDNTHFEYVEVKNTGTAPESLYDPHYPANTWKIDGIGFSFPAATILQAGEAAVIISSTIAEAQFRTLHSVPAAAKVFTMTGSLSNDQDSLALLKPAEPYIDGTTIVPCMTIDKVNYKDSSPWPGADGDGQALIRKNVNAYGNDPQNWTAGSPGPGR